MMLKETFRWKLSGPFMSCLCLLSWYMYAFMDLSRHKNKDLKGEIGFWPFTYLFIFAVTGFRFIMSSRNGTWARGRGLEPWREAGPGEEDEKDSEKGEEEAKRGWRDGDSESFWSNSKPASLWLPHLVRPADLQNSATYNEITMLKRCAFMPSVSRNSWHFFLAFLLPITTHS